jgi:hypothetical protein
VETGVSILIPQLSQRNMVSPLHITQCSRWLGPSDVGVRMREIAQSEKGVASYEVLVPAKSFGSLGAIAIN